MEAKEEDQVIARVDSEHNLPRHLSCVHRHPWHIPQSAHMILPTSLTCVMSIQPCIPSRGTKGIRKGSTTVVIERGSGLRRCLLWA
jgi:hypothetical protein